MRKFSLLRQEAMRSTTCRVQVSVRYRVRDRVRVRGRARIRVRVTVGVRIRVQVRVRTRGRSVQYTASDAVIISVATSCRRRISLPVLALNARGQR